MKTIKIVCIISSFLLVSLLVLSKAYAAIEIELRPVNGDGTLGNRINPDIAISRDVQYIDVKILNIPIVDDTNDNFFMTTIRLYKSRERNINDPLMNVFVDGDNPCDIQNAYSDFEDIACNTFSDNSGPTLAISFRINLSNLHDNIELPTGTVNESSYTLDNVVGDSNALPTEARFTIEADDKPSPGEPSPFKIKPTGGVVPNPARPGVDALTVTLINAKPNQNYYFSVDYTAIAGAVGEYSTKNLSNDYVCSIPEVGDCVLKPPLYLSPALDAIMQEETCAPDSCTDRFGQKRKPTKKGTATIVVYEIEKGGIFDPETTTIPKDTYEIALIDAATPTPNPPPCLDENGHDLINQESGKCQAFVTSLGRVQTDPATFISRILTIILGISGGIALILIIRSGYLMVISRGDAEKVQEAKEILTAAIVGLLFIIFSMVILEVITVDIFKIPGFSR